MKRSKPLRRRTPLRAKTGLRRTAISRTVRSTGPTLSARKLLAERSGGRCEVGLPGCWGTATDVHHRVNRQAGGRHGASRVRLNQLSALIHCCRLCHQWITTRPAWAADLGLSLRDWQEPHHEPVLLFAHAQIPVYLDDAGGVVPMNSPAGQGSPRIALAPSPARPGP